MPGTLLATTIIAICAICFGLVPLFARVLLDAGLSAEAIALYRFCLAVPLALVFLPRSRSAFRPVMALAGAGLAGGLGWTAYLDAIDQVSVASAGIVYMSYPLFVVVLARLLVGQAITPRAMAGAALVVTGGVIVNATVALPQQQWLILLSILPAPIGYALIVVMLSTVGHELTTLQRWSAVVLGHVAGLLPAAVLADSGSLLPATPQGWIWIAGIAALTALLPQIGYAYASRFVTAARASAAGAAELPSMLAIGWLAFGEAIGPREAVGALLVIAAIVVSPDASPTGGRMPRWLPALSRERQ